MLFRNEAVEKLTGLNVALNSENTIITDKDTLDQMEKPIFIVQRESAVVVIPGA